MPLAEIAGAVWDFGGVGCELICGPAGSDPGRAVARHSLDIRLQLDIVLDVVRSVVADDIDHRHARFARIVQVCKAIAEAAAQVQQRRCRLAGHARITVRCAGRHAFKQAEDCLHVGTVERRNKVHF